MSFPGLEIAQQKNGLYFIKDENLSKFEAILTYFYPIFNMSRTSFSLLSKCICFCKVNFLSQIVKKVFMILPINSHS